MSWAFLKTSIELFGIIDGLKQWFEWYIKWPIQKFIWLNIVHKPYCTFCGWGCHEGCKHPKLTRKEDILKHWEKQNKESEKIIQGSNGECAYCGKFKGRELIPDPNGSLARWNVCVTCKKIIKAQQKLSFAMIMLEKETDERLKEFWKKELEKAEEEINFLSEESFMPTFSFIIRKQKNGEKNNRERK